MSDKKEPMIINEKPGKKLYCLCGKQKLLHTAMEHIRTARQLNLLG